LGKNDSNLAIVVILLAFFKKEPFDFTLDYKYSEIFSSTPSRALLNLTWGWFDLSAAIITGMSSSFFQWQPYLILLIEVTSCLK